MTLVLAMLCPSEHFCKYNKDFAVLLLSNCVWIGEACMVSRPVVKYGKASITVYLLAGNMALNYHFITSKTEYHGKV